MRIGVADHCVEDGRIEQAQNVAGRGGAGAANEIEAGGKAGSALDGIFMFGRDAERLTEILLVDTPDRAPSVAAVVSLDEKIGDGRSAARLDRRHGETGGGGQSH